MTMEILKAGSGSATIVLNQRELRTLHSSLNEVCNGIDIDPIEFPTRIGASRESALKLLAQLSRVIDQAEGSET